MKNTTWITSAAGVTMPPLIYGTAWKQARTAELVELAILAGFRGIDTAAQPKHYDEAQVGVALQRLKAAGITRESLYLQTKYTPFSGQDPSNVPYDPSAPLAQQVAQSFTTSQRNLKTDYVDCLILHSPLSTHAKTMQAWAALEAIHAAGGARQLGISNCYALADLQAIYADAKAKPAVVQNRFHAKTGYDAVLRLWCADQHVIYESFWTLTANPHLLKSKPIQTIAGTLRKTPAQILFRYLNQSGVVPLTGTTSAQHMREDLAMVEFTLSSEDIKRISELLI